MCCTFCLPPQKSGGISPLFQITSWVRGSSSHWESWTQKLRAIKISYLILTWKHLKVRAWLERWREDCSWRMVHSQGWRGEGVSFHGWDAESGLNHSDSCCSVAKSCPVLCDLMNCSTLGSSVLYSLPEFAQIHVHRVSEATLPSHPLPPPSTFALSLSQHQGLFQWVSSSHQVAKSVGTSASASILPVNIQGWCPLGLTGLISLQFKGVSRVFSRTTAQRHLFFSAQPSSLSNSHICTWLLEKP